MDNLSPTPAAPPSHSGWKGYVLFGTLFALLSGGAYLFWRLDRLETTISDWRGSMLTEISELRETGAAGRTTQGQRLEALRAELDAAKRQAAVSAGRAKTEAEKHAERLAKQLAEDQQKQEQRMTTELTEMKESATTANTKVADVRNEVAATKAEVDSAVADLKRVTGDMGVMSGLIATNSHELAALRELGERNYFEFSLTKTKQPQRIGDIRMQLKKTDPGRNKYTIELTADDKKVEKKDKSLNEPVQFYVSKARQPYEVVVNEVKKERIIGYLATPKVQMARK